MEQAELLALTGKIIRKKRKAKGLSQERLAEIANLHPTYISNIEQGKVNASIFTFYQLSNALQVEFAELLNLPTKNVDRALEQELSEIVSRIRCMEKDKRGLLLFAVKGILSGLEGQT